MENVIKTIHVVPSQETARRSPERSGSDGAFGGLAEEREFRALAEAREGSAAELAHLRKQVMWF